MSLTIVVLLFVLLCSIVFEYINGFHDSANAIATIVSTKVLSPRYAVIYGAVLNVLGAFAGTHVAKTIGGGIVDVVSVTQLVIACALLSAIIWNLITWYYGIPSSSSHALIGGLIGAAMMRSGHHVVHIKGVVDKVIIPMITSPILGLLVGFSLMLILLWAFQRVHPEWINKYFRKFQLFSSGFLAFSHGSNDAQKTMGIMTLALYSAGFIKHIDVPFWVILTCAITMGFGTMAGGWKIIRTMASKMIKLKPINGFAAEAAAATVILSASHFGLPVSTTHVISTSIMGVGSTKRLSAVKWGIVGNIMRAWVLTIPVCMILAAGIYFIIERFSFIKVFFGH